MLRTLECDRMQFVFTNITTAKLVVQNVTTNFFREYSYGNLFRPRKRARNFFSFTNVTTDDFCCRM